MLKLARTNAEAHLYMELHPCSCGESNFSRKSAVVMIDDDLASRYTGACENCGAERIFEFRLPRAILPQSADGVMYGDSTPSELLDPGEWLSVADSYARSVPGGKLEGEDLRVGRRRLAIAVAALDEIRKFAPPGATEVPETAFTTSLGRAIREKEPGRFRLIRLQAVREAYANFAAEM